MSANKPFGLVKAAYFFCAGVGYTAVGMHVEQQQRRVEQREELTKSF